MSETEFLGKVSWVYEKSHGNLVSWTIADRGWNAEPLAKNPVSRAKVDRPPTQKPGFFAKFREYLKNIAPNPVSRTIPLCKILLQFT